MIWSNESKHLIKVPEVLKDPVLKYSVEFMLNWSKDRSLFIFIDTTGVEIGVPIKFVQVKQLKIVDYLADTSLHFCFIHILVVLPWLVFWHLDTPRFKPDSTTLKPGKNVSKRKIITF